MKLTFFIIQVFVSGTLLYGQVNAEKPQVNSEQTRVRTYSHRPQRTELSGRRHATKWEYTEQIAVYAKLANDIRLARLKALMDANDSKIIPPGHRNGSTAPEMKRTKVGSVNARKTLGAGKTSLSTRVGGGAKFFSRTSRFMKGSVGYVGDAVNISDVSYRHYHKGTASNREFNRIYSKTGGGIAGRVVGGFSGEAIGTWVGGIIGSSVAPGPGTIAGAAIGATIGDFIGGMLGFWVGSELSDYGITKYYSRMDEDTKREVEAHINRKFDYKEYNIK